jgi:beta-glucosidase
MQITIRVGVLGLVFALLATGTVRASDEADRQAAALVKQMTIEEKVGQLVSSAPAIPRLGVPSYEWWNEALHGLQANVDTTDYHAPIGLAATFDDRLIHEVAGAISEEVRAVHANTRAAGEVGAFAYGAGLNVWAPVINIFRDPRWGRGQETYGEDPFLAARMGVAYVQGMQGPDPSAPAVIATPKHFAVYSGPESTRHGVDVKVSIHDLEDTYLPAFRAAIVAGQAGSIMCSYNGVNGQPACANDFLLKDKLRGDWGFKGYAVSDCGAVEDLYSRHHYVPDVPGAMAAAVKAGVDLECISPIQGDRVKRYTDALARGLLTVADVDQAVTRLFAARIRVGDLTPEGRPIRGTPMQVLTTAHRALAGESAEKSIVLLKNSALLPLRGAQLKMIVTGPLANSVRVLRSSYSSANVPSPVSILQGLRAQFPHAAIRYVPAGPSYTDGDPIPAAAFLTADGAPGITAEYFAVKASDPAHPEQDLRRPGGPAYEATPFKSAVVTNIGQDIDAERPFYLAVYSGSLTVPQTGSYRLGLKGMSAKLTFDGKPLAKLEGYPPPQLGDLATVRLEKGHRYPFRVEVMKSYLMDAHFVWSAISEDPAAALRDAARDADVIVAVVGLTAELESEETSLDVPGFFNGDRTSLDLPADQQQLLQDAKATGRKLVVINLSAGAVNLAWARENADAVLQGWYPGEEGGNAIARVLAGKVNPAGRLPVTFYRDIASLPPFDDYSMQNRTYRYFKGMPVYPFGYGLSYTSFRYGALEVSRHSADAAFTVRTRLTNTGPIAGDEVAQLYLKFPDAPGVPRIALRGFQRVHLLPRETQTVEFELTPRELSSVSEAGEHRVLAGRYVVSVGGGQPAEGVAGASTELRIDGEVKVAK